MADNKEVLFSKLPIGGYFNPHDKWGRMDRVLVKVTEGSAMYLKPGAKAFIGGMIGNTICTPISIS